MSKSRRKFYEEQKAFVRRSAIVDDAYLGRAVEIVQYYPDGGYGCPYVVRPVNGLPLREISVTEEELAPCGETGCYHQG